MILRSARPPVVAGHRSGAEQNGSTRADVPTPRHREQRGGLRSRKHRARGLCFNRGTQNEKWVSSECHRHLPVPVGVGRQGANQDVESGDGAGCRFTDGSVRT